MNIDCSSNRLSSVRDRGSSDSVALLTTTFTLKALISLFLESVPNCSSLLLNRAINDCVNCKHQNRNSIIGVINNLQIDCMIYFYKAIIVAFLSKGASSIVSPLSSNLSVFRLNFCVGRTRTDIMERNIATVQHAVIVQ